MRRETRRRFGQGLEIVPRRADRAQAADEFHAHSLFHLFGLAQQDRTNLPCTAHVSAAAGVEVEVANVDQTQPLAFSSRNLPDAHGSCLLRSSEANLHRTILGDDLIRQSLGSL